MAKFTAMLDTEAESAYNSLMSSNNFLNPEHAKRFACLQAAEGSNQFTNISTTRLLNLLQPQTYFSPIIPSIIPSSSQISGRRRKYQLAYIITASGDPDMLENLQTLTSILDDGSAVFLVHVDKRSEKLYESMRVWLEERNRLVNEHRARKKLPPGFGNVFLARNRYAGIWGHISMVHVQLSASWELLDLADWEFVINISLQDFPLRRSREIFRTLSRKENIGRNFISFELENYLSASRLTRPHIARGQNLTDVAFNHGPHQPHEIGLMFPSFTNWKVCVSPQWMILSREFVNHLRTSDRALQPLAFFEFTYIPDQSFFCQVLLNDPIFKHTIVNDMKRYIDFHYYGSQHAAMLTLDHRHWIGYQFFSSQEPKYYFIRKVNPKSDEGKSLVNWVFKYHINKHVMPDEVYGPLEEKEWVPLDSVI
ncbi:hypothetical protein HDU97_007172 [Phlyctochytrium planicorne]|nr:hypothetical protein HDU97_007172 [Phlyctochytrium planicorne]